MNKRTQAEMLVQLSEVCRPFHTPLGEAYVDIPIEDRRETLPVRSRAFRLWLGGEHYGHRGGAPAPQALRAALDLIEARAVHDGPERIVHVRTAREGDRIYVDLCEPGWQAIEVGPSGWRIVREAPVRFYRASGMFPLPVPARGGSIHALRTFLNIKNDDDFVLTVSWILAAMRGEGPYPVLVLAGEQGSAKSTFASVIRALIDPNMAALRALPRENRDFFIAAKNGHVLAFDNVSSLRPEISDTACRLATGGGFAVRRLYSDENEAIFAASRPIIFNGIEDVANRADLADRALFITLPPISESQRRTERDFWADFEAQRPLILGALLDALVVGLRELPSTRLPKLPRMADFALWSAACETGYWAPGTFWRAYELNRVAATETVLDADPFASALRKLVHERGEWLGTATALLADLDQMVSDSIRKSAAWPRAPQAVSGRLRRVETALRAVGILVESVRARKAGTRTVRVWIENKSSGADGDVASSASSASSATRVPFDVEQPIITIDKTPVAPTQIAGADEADDADDDFARESPVDRERLFAWRARL